MIISKIDGGLGNQMFQYAYGAYLANQHGCEHILDTQAYASGPQHGYLLNHFSVKANTANDRILKQLPARHRPSSIASAWYERMMPSRIRRHKEKEFGFHRKHLDTPKNSYLVGYWQSERFFPGMRKQLDQDFKLQTKLSDESARIADEIHGTNSITLHIRRGDYLTNSAAANLYEQLPLQYYLDAAQRWAEQHTNTRVFVFSNDIPWCKKSLNLPWPTRFIDHTRADTAYEDMAMMKLAACNVIANSTFSWWSAWLNKRTTCVYAPNRWFRPGTMDDSSIIPASWNLINLPAHAAAA